MKIKIGSALNNFKKLYANGGPGDNLDLSAHPNFYNQASKPWTVDDSKKMVDNNPALYDAQRHYKQGIAEPPIQADYTPEMIAAAVAMPAAQGFGKVGNFVADAITGTMRSPVKKAWQQIPLDEWPEKFSKSSFIDEFRAGLNEATAPLNPKNSKAVDGLEWSKQWYDNPITQEKTRKYNYPGFYNETGDPFYYANNQLEQYIPKNYNNLYKDKGLKTWANNFFTTDGLSYGTPDGIYIKNQRGFDKVGHESTRVHELTHLAENNGNLLSHQADRELSKPFDIGPISNGSMSKSQGYYTDPTEIHARMNEARYRLNKKPGDSFTDDDFNSIQKKHDWFGMGQYIKDKEGFIDLMNNFYTPAAGVAVAGGTATLSNNKQKFAAGGTFKPYGNANDPYQMSSPNNTFPGSTNSFPSNSRSAVGNNSITPPRMAEGTMDTSGVGTKPGATGADIAGYAGMANTALSMFNTTQNDDYMMGNDTTVSGIIDGVKQVPVAGQFVALGDTGSDMLYQQASKTSGVDSSAWAGAAGTVSPASGWEKKNEMYKSGEIDSTEFGISTLAHFVMPGLDTMYLQDKHNDNVNAGKKVESNLKDNQQFYQNNIGAYDAQMSRAQGKQFGKGGSNSNVWTLVDDSNPLAYGGQMTTEYKTGGTHEQNPNGGIPIGNSLVEEGEIRFDYLENKQPKSYIFSNRLKYKKNGK